MRQILLHITMLISALICLFLSTLLSCGREDTPVVPGVTQEQIFNADGGFVITKSMLNEPYNQITFPATHNSFASPNWHDACANQRLTIPEQLLYGIRCIELDVDADLCASHNGWCKRPLAEILYEIAEYAKMHRGQVITVRVSDLACDLRAGSHCHWIIAPNHEWGDLCVPIPTCCQSALSPDQSLESINTLLEITQIATYVYNWNGSITDNSNPAKCYVPEPWPTLGEIIRSGRNIIFIHHRDVHDIVDSGYFRGLDFSDYSDATYHDVYASYQLADLSKIQPVWEPGICARQKEGSQRLFLLECNSQYYKHCGVGVTPVYTRWEDCPTALRSCNDGRRLYQLAKQHEEDYALLPGDRVVNYIAVDYYMCSQHQNGGYRLPINVVDACNRLNYERFGFEWSNSYYAWETEPYEFDHSKIEYIRQIPALRQEVDNAISDYQSIDEGLHGHEARGAIVSTPVYEQCDWSGKGSVTDWLWLPEWAVDDDYYTAWQGAGWYGSLGIDLGSAKLINEIAIAWKYAHLAPGYTVYVANALEGDFADALNSSEGWTQVAQTTARWLGHPQAWDRVTFDQNSWRYIKIEVTQGGVGWGSAIFELRVYGPAN